MDNKQENHSSARALTPLGESKILPFFSADENFIFVLKKAERLVSALYLVTSFFDEKEPLRWRIRTLGSDLLSAALSTKDSHKVSRDKVVSDMRNLILEIESLMSVARNAGLISEPNHSIIDREFANLLERISPNLDNPGITEGFFVIPTTERGGGQVEETTRVTPGERTASDSRGSYKGQILDESVMARGVGSSRTRAARDDGVVSVKKNKRQAVILDLVRHKKEIMIKDVSPLISGVSEKTIQRELLSMVKSGILKKEGEKRWSRYALA